MLQELQKLGILERMMRWKVDGAPASGESQEPRCWQHRGQRSATFAALVQGAIALMYNTTMTYLCNKSKSTLKPEICRSHGSYGIWIVLFCFVFAHNMANKCVASLPSRPLFLTIPVWSLCPVWKESSWRGIDFARKRQDPGYMRTCRLPRGSTLMRDLPFVGVPGAPASLPDRYTPQLRGAQRGHGTPSLVPFESPLSVFPSLWESGRHTGSEQRTQGPQGHAWNILLNSL